MKLTTFATAMLISATLPVQAGFMMGHAGAEAATAVLDTVISYADETTAAELSTQQDAITELRTQLDELLAAEEQDTAAISDVRSQLHDARHDLRDDIRDIVSDNEELKASLQEQRDAARQERQVTGYALRNETAFASLVEAATEEQAASLEANQSTLEELRTQADEARAAGATRSEVSELRDQMRSLIQEQADVVAEVLEANEELQTEFATATTEIASDMREQRGGGRRGHH